MGARTRPLRLSPFTGSTIALWRGGGSAELLSRRAASQGRLGDLDGARASVARLLGWWNRADADLPRLALARELPSCRGTWQKLHPQVAAERQLRGLHFAEWYQWLVERMEEFPAPAKKVGAYEAHP